MEGRELVYITVQPANLYFAWQTDVQLHNFRKYNISHLMHVLIFIEDGERAAGLPQCWKDLKKKYPETKFFVYEDDENIQFHLVYKYGYIPFLRPWTLEKHFLKFPELSEKAIFYLDSDVIFTQPPDFKHLIDDDVNYLSYTMNGARGFNYLDYMYLQSKIDQVKPDMQDMWIQWDMLSHIAKKFNITKETLIDNIDNTGGAQYLLKNIDHTFWKDMVEGLKYLLIILRFANQHYMIGENIKEREDNGIQAWCSDMWALLYTLWGRGAKTLCPKEMDFIWASDKIEKWNTVLMYHDAGASTRPVEEGHRLFHKREECYITNATTPFKEDLSFVSPSYCSYNYVQEILACKNSINNVTEKTPNFKGLRKV